MNASSRFNLTSNLSPEQLHQELEDLASLGSDKPKDGDSGEFTIQALWRAVCDRKDIIVVIDKVDEPRLRRQLSTLKAKDNAKLKSADIPTDDSTLEFVLHKDSDLDIQNQVKLQIYLKEKPKVKLHKFIVPGGA